MTVPIIFRDVNFHIYTISPDCKIYKSGEIIPIDDIIYHSTNGFDYVLLETLSGEKKLYMLDFVMYNSFYPQTQHNHKYFKVFHLDGDKNNHHIDNLDYEEDVEEWRPVNHNRVKPNQYIVSSWGHVISLYDKYGNYRKHNMSFHQSHNGYVQFSMIDINGCVKHFRIHTIVAYAFHDGEHNIGLDVNHIDGDKTNNHYSNLEYITRSSNVTHALAIGLNKLIGESHHNAKLTESDVHFICDTLVRTDGNIKQTTEAFNDAHEKQLLNSTIEHIKYKDTWRNISDGYFVHGQFKKCIMIYMGA